MLVDWDEAVVPPDNCEMAAHVVQAAADAGVDAVDECLRRASALLERGHDKDPAVRKLEGAVGRALATMRHYDTAADRLAATVRSWIAHGEIGESSFAVCEWLRVTAIIGHDGHWLEAVECAEQYMASEAGQVGLGPWFVRFALGRGRSPAGTSRVVSRRSTCPAGSGRPTSSRGR